jgi:hypothetical protein
MFPCACLSSIRTVWHGQHPTQVPVQAQVSCPLLVLLPMHIYPQHHNIFDAQGSTSTPQTVRVIAQHNY